MSFIKTYFLCPTSDFIHPPPTGPIFLGSLIRSTSAPQFSLNKANVVPLADEMPSVVETDWKKTVSAETALGMGIYAQFLQLATGGLGLGPEVDVEHSRRRTNMFEFDSVTTVSFEPTSEYVEEAVKAPAVQAWLKEPKQRFSPVVSLYLITGMKIVKGAKIRYVTSSSSAITGNIGIDAAPVGMSFGPKGHWNRTNEDETEFNRASEFVFAFRVKRIRFGRKLKVEDYTRGAFLATGKGDNDQISVLVEDVDGADLNTAALVSDTTEGSGVYCVPT